MKAQTLTVLLLVLAIIAISIWISLASDDINRQLQAISEQQQQQQEQEQAELEAFEAMSYAEDAIPIQFVEGPRIPQCQRLQKFPGGGLFCNPSTDTDHIDLYSAAEGNVASTNSSGLHNSRGPLVLNDEMVKLLSTRGSNATGVPDSDLL